MWTILNFQGRSKTKKLRGDICKGTLIIEFEQDRPVDLSATLGDWQTKAIFIVSGIFPGKADSVVIWPSNVL